MGNELLGTAVEQGRQFDTSMSVSHTLVTGWNRIVFAVISGWRVGNFRTLSNVQYGGQTMTLLASIARFDDESEGLSLKEQVFFLLEADLPSNGANNLTATWSGDCGHNALVWCIENATQETPPVVASSFDAAIPQIDNYDTDITVGNEGDSIFGAGATNEGPTWTVDVAQTEIIEGTGTDPDLCSWYEHGCSAGVDNHGYTLGTNVFYLFIILWTVTPLEPPVGPLTLMLGGNF